MPATRKPKKVLIQFAVALVVAIGLGVVALVVGFTIIQGVSSQAQKAQEEMLQKQQELDAEKKRLQAEQENLQRMPKSYKVVQASVDLVPGQPITQDMLTLITQEERPANGTLSMLSQAVGKVAKSLIIRGEPLESTKLLDAGGFISVQEGMRAITIPVDMVGGLNGALIPGSRVDILTTVNQGDSAMTRTLLQNIQVISVGGDNGSSGSGSELKATASKAQAASNNSLPITVLVTPKQAEALAFANTMSSFHLTLRNFSDKKTMPMGGADLTTLVTGVPSTSSSHAMPGPPKPPGSSGFHNVNFMPDAAGLPNPAEAAPPAPKFSMQIYRGTGSETVDFQQR